MSKYFFRRLFMKSKVSVFVVCFAVSVCLLLAAGASFAQKSPPATVTIKLEGAKMAPVTFSHGTHVDKAKVDCAVCHHKDADAKNPAACTTCHAVKEAKGGASVAKDAFHGKCQGCHKDAASKGKAAPTKCAECHKK
jgi:hypothetical protein